MNSGLWSLVKIGFSYDLVMMRPLLSDQTIAELWNAGNWEKPAKMDTDRVDALAFSVHCVIPGAETPVTPQSSLWKGGQRPPNTRAGRELSVLALRWA